MSSKSSLEVVLSRTMQQRLADEVGISVIESYVAILTAKLGALVDESEQTKLQYEFVDSQHQHLLNSINMMRSLAQVVPGILANMSDTKQTYIRLADDL